MQTVVAGNRAASPSKHPQADASGRPDGASLARQRNGRACSSTCLASHCHVVARSPPLALQGAKGAPCDRVVGDPVRDAPSATPGRAPGACSSAALRAATMPGQPLGCLGGCESTLRSPAALSVLGAATEPLSLLSRLRLEWTGLGCVGPAQDLPPPGRIESHDPCVTLATGGASAEGPGAEIHPGAPSHRRRRLAKGMTCDAQCVPLRPAAIWRCPPARVTFSVLTGRGERLFRTHTPGAGLTEGGTDAIRRWQGLGEG
jgi:hypothetical protein